MNNDRRRTYNGRNQAIDELYIIDNYCAANTGSFTRLLYSDDKMTSLKFGCKLPKLSYSSGYVVLNQLNARLLPAGDGILYSVTATGSYYSPSNTFNLKLHIWKIDLNNFDYTLDIDAEYEDYKEIDLTFSTYSYEGSNGGYYNIIADAYIHNNKIYVWIRPGQSTYNKEIVYNLSTDTIEKNGSIYEFYPSTNYGNSYYFMHEGILYTKYTNEYNTMNIRPSDKNGTIYFSAADSEEELDRINIINNNLYSSIDDAEDKVYAYTNKLSNIVNSKSVYSDKTIYPPSNGIIILSNDARYREGLTTNAYMIVEESIYYKYPVYKLNLSNSSISYQNDLTTMFTQFRNWEINEYEDFHIINGGYYGYSVSYDGFNTHQETVVKNATLAGYSNDEYSSYSIFIRGNSSDHHVIKV